MSKNESEGQVVIKADKSPSKVSRNVLRKPGEDLNKTKLLIMGGISAA